MKFKSGKSFYSHHTVIFMSEENVKLYVCNVFEFAQFEYFDIVSITF
jgi:hypothetical protein